jgi:hypothetical protein
MNIVELVAKTNSRMFTVVFRKANGEIRTMLCKTGIKKHLSKKPNKRSYKKSSNTINVFDMEAKQYRSFKPESVISFKCGNVKV